MNRPYWAICVALLFAPLLLFATSVGGGQPHYHESGKMVEEPINGRAPETLPSIPQPDPRAAQVPPGYRVEVVLARLNYPTSVEFDDVGTMYVAEGGYIYGDDVAPARILRVSAGGETETVADDLNGPITDLLWHDSRLYVSHRGKISVLESSRVRDLVTGLPSLGDHHNNQLAVGPDGKIYFGQGTATNSGVVGLDNFKMGWLANYPEVCDIPAKDIRLHDQVFETPDPLTLLADKRRENGEEAQGPKPGQGHEGHGEQKPQREGQEHAGQESDKPETGHEGHGAPKPRSEGQQHEGHEPTSKPGKAAAPANPKESAPADEHAGHAKSKQSTKAETRANGKEPAGSEKESTKATKGKSHEGHAAQGNETQTGIQHEGHGQSPMANGQETGKGHEGHGAAQSSERGNATTKTVTAKSFAFQPFAKTPPDDGAVRGTTKASGTILRMNSDGSDMEMFAWGLRNPFGLMWGQDGNLYASDNGYDERGSRPIAHAPDCLWTIKQDAWYGFPDFAGGIPVTDTRFAPEHGPAPKFLMRDHPSVEKPLLTLAHHAGAAKIDISNSKNFGYEGHLFLALAGDMNPITGIHEERSGFEVVQVDPDSGEAETFFKAKKNALGPKGMEYVVTAGPRRPVDVRFSPDGNALYVVDVGAMAILSTATGPAPRPFPSTGVVWRITRDVGNRAAKSPARPERSLR